MTEEEWLVCEDPTQMLGYLQGKASDRKLRLFACNCCRRFWHLMGERAAPPEVERAEQFADGEVELGATEANPLTARCQRRLLFRLGR